MVGSGIPIDGAFADYDGVLSIKRLPRVNTLAPILPETVRYGFKVLMLLC